MSEHGKESTAPAKGVAVVEEVPGTQNGGAMWRVLRDGVAYVSDYRGDFQWCVVVSEYDGTWFSDRDIAEAVAAAINARASKPTAHWHNDLGGNRKIPVSNDSLANSIADFAYALGRAANELASRTWGAK